MDSQPTNNIIRKSPGEDHALDFDFLRTKGIELIQRYAGKNWTDYNLHDPGVTILEYICYGLTDVAYRTTFSIIDLLADKNGKIDRNDNYFFPKEEVLSSGPVTVNDYRKLLIDAVPELDNVWLEPIRSLYSSTYIKGAYHVIIQPDTSFTSAAAKDTGQEKQLIKKVKSMLMEYRNIGDSYETFTVLKPTPVFLRADIIIGKDVSPEPLLAKIYQALEKAMNPAVTFYTEAQLLARGMAIEDIYSGPLLHKGILPDNELKKRMTTMDPSLLMKAIGGLEGVVSIKMLEISLDGQQYETGTLEFKSGYFPSMKDQHPEIGLYHDNFKLFIRRADVIIKEHLTKRQLMSSSAEKRPVWELTGEYKNLQDYVSIQTLFPAIYGISENGSSASLSAAEIAKSRQLKAYLMLFEQLMANSLAQMNGITKLFSKDISADNATYNFLPLYQVPDAKYILKAFTDKNGKQDWDSFKNKVDNGYVRNMRQFIESNEEYKDRKKRAFDHMLSRFNIAVYKHPVFLYEFYYEQEDHHKRVDLEVKWKAAILYNLAAFTTTRLQADNYETLKEDEGLTSGFARKMSLLLHIKSGTRRRLGNIVDKYQKSLGRTSSSSTGTDLGEKPKEEDGLTENLTFKGQTELLFQSAIVLKNYRISSYPHPDSPTKGIYFKHPNDTDWRILSKHADEYSALTALKETIRLFREISMESEGFYLLEHLMLKPSFQSASYGFTFVDQQGKVMIEQLHWQSFAEREETIFKLRQVAQSAAHKTHKDIVADLKNLCKFKGYWLKKNEGQHIDGEPGKAAIKDLLYNLRQSDPNNASFYPSFKYKIKHSSGQIVKEDFYNFRMTIVFPSWPARFQDENFKTLAKKIFKEECPAHIKISILWLPVAQMKNFDHLYFGWLKNLQNDAASKDAYANSEELSQFIMNHQAYVDDGER